ncbi:MAG: lactonase family protein [Terracidiphilus sp.]
MKFSKTSQLVVASAIGLAAASFLAGCQIVTIDYVFVACSAGGSTGEILTYAADSQSGALRQVNKAVTSGISDPVALATSSNYFSLYVANQGNSSIAHFGIADTGVLSPLDTVTTAEPPIYLAVNQADTYLYVISGATSATLTEYPLDKDGKIGAAVAQEALTLPSNPGDTIVSTSVVVLPNNSGVYVSAYDQSAYNPGGSVSSTAHPGWIFGFNVDSSGGLAPTPGNPYQAGVKPASLAAEPSSTSVNRFIYATDFASNQLIGYTIQSNNALSFMINGPFRTGSQPTAIQVDPRGSYIYLANSLDNDVSAYTINLPTGTPSTVVNVTSSALYSTDTQPVALAIDPALARFVYTANFLGNSISGFRLNPDSGSLTDTQATPYPTGKNPTALVIVPHGNHATQSVTP